MIQKIELSAALNSLATQSNIDKVTGMLGSSAANISKADLATVVAGIVQNHVIGLAAGATHEIANSKNPCFGLFIQAQYTLKMDVVIFYSDIAGVILQQESSKGVISYFADGGSVSVYRPSSGANLIVKNNTSAPISFRYKILVMP